MSLTHWGWLWGAVVVAVGLLDLAVRLGTGWSMARVVRAEAALFLAASLVLLVLHRRRPAPAGWARTVQVGLAASFALGGLRAAFWALGVPVHWANLLIGVLAVVGLASVLWRLRLHGNRRR
jgi:hypothetical protein